jgi:hypothetical protein
VDDAQTGLFASVCHALTRAGYDFGATDPANPGLYVTQDGQHVRIRWTPAPELIAPSIPRPEHGEALSPGMRDAIHAALATVLADAGFTIAASDEPNTLRVTGTTLPG